MMKNQASYLSLKVQYGKNPRTSIFQYQSAKKGNTQQLESRIVGGYILCVCLRNHPREVYTLGRVLLLLHGKKGRLVLGGSILPEQTENAVMIPPSLSREFNF